MGTEGLRYKHPPGVHYLVCVDPGARLSGVAIGKVSPAVSILGEVGTVPSDELLDWVYNRAIRKWPVVWCAEEPQDYKGFGVAHPDLDRLRGVLNRLPPLAKQWHPHAWKGNVPKRIHHQRIIHFLSDGEEMALYDHDHNAWDAAALWLWATGRCGRGGTRV